jgi:hypothetical protein
MTNRDRVRLLHGPYTAPPLRKGDRAICLLRDTDVIITGWTSARISWPRCRALDGPGGGSGILLDEELARAVRCESAAAICYWWRVVRHEAWRWNEGTEARLPPVPRPLVQASDKPLGRSPGGCKPAVK